MAIVTPMETLYLIDGSNLLFRAYHALPPMNTSRGEPTSALVGLSNMLLKLEKNHRPQKIAVVFDAGGDAQRSILHKEYKAHRPPCPPDLKVQIPIVQDLLRKLGYIVLVSPDAEADDVIATLTRQALADNAHVVIVSSDKDLMQLCSDRVAVLETMKNNGVGKLYGPIEVKEQFGVFPSQLGDLLALMGDSSDNIPGVPGIGAKTAARLLNQFGSVATLMAQLQEVPPPGADRIRHALQNHQDQLQLSRELVRLRDDVSLPVSWSDLARAAPDAAALETLLERYELKGLLGRLLPNSPVRSVAQQQPLFSKLQQNSDHAQASLAALQPTKSHESVAYDPAQLVSWLSQHQYVYAVSFLLSGEKEPLSARTAPLCGIAFARLNPSDLAEPLSSFYLPLHHRYLGAPPLVETDVWTTHLRPFFESSTLRKCVYDAKQAHLLLQRCGISLRGLYSDPALCSYLLDPGQQHSLHALALRHMAGGDASLQTREQFCQRGKQAFSIDSFPIDEVAVWACQQARVTVWLGHHLLSLLSAEARDILERLELPLARVLSIMEQNGILIDVTAIRQLSSEIAVLLRNMEQEVRQAAGYDVNIQSPKQLQELLFSKLGLPSTKKTKTGFSTDAEVLEQLALLHPIAHTIHQHRSLAKLKNTYLDLLPLSVDAQTGRLHTTYHQVAAATGRLSSTDPNLQSIPIRTEWGERIRRTFTAAPGYVLISADYSQIELRMLAHLSGDPVLLESFRSGEDIHQRTAVDMFGESAGKTPDMRRVAKMINYGIMYGLSEHGLATRLSISRTEAKQYIQRHIQQNPAVHQFLEDLVDRARTDGGAYTMLGRFRPLPDLRTGGFQARALAERMAKNTPLQGSAADLLKKAMIDVQRTLDENPTLGGRMLLSVHDELVLEAPTVHQHTIADLLRQNMEQAMMLQVPLVVDVGIGTNWDNCKK